MNKILVGIDGSEASQKAARFAANLASFYGAKVTLMYVAPHSIDTKMSARLTYSASKTIDVDHKLDEAEKIMDMRRLPTIPLRNWAMLLNLSSLNPARSMTLLFSGRGA